MNGQTPDIETTFTLTAKILIFFAHIAILLVGLYLNVSVLCITQILKIDLVSKKMGSGCTCLFFGGIMDNVWNRHINKIKLRLENFHHSETNQIIDEQKIEQTRSYQNHCKILKMKQIKETCHYNYSPYNFLIANMSLADLIYLLAQPFFAIHQNSSSWEFGEYGCKILSSVDSSFRLICPSFVCFIAIERLLMVWKMPFGEMRKKARDSMQVTTPTLGINKIYFRIKTDISWRLAYFSCFFLWLVNFSVIINIYKHAKIQNYYSFDEHGQYITNIETTCHFTVLQHLFEEDNGLIGVVEEDVIMFLRKIYVLENGKNDFHNIHMNHGSNSIDNRTEAISTNLYHWPSYQIARKILELEDLSEDYLYEYTNNIDRYLTYLDDTSRQPLKEYLEVLKNLTLSVKDHNKLTLNEYIYLHLNDAESKKNIESLIKFNLKDKANFVIIILISFIAPFSISALAYLLIISKIEKVKQQSSHLEPKHSRSKINQIEETLRNLKKQIKFILLIFVFSLGIFHLVEGFGTFRPLLVAKLLEEYLGLRCLIYIVGLMVQVNHILNPSFYAFREAIKSKNVDNYQHFYPPPI